MHHRRAFLGGTAALSLLAALPVAMSTATLAGQAPRLLRRPIPGTQDSLPVIGLGNSNAFRSGDMETSKALIDVFYQHGGAYIDCSGDSRFVVADAAAALNIGEDVFLGSYFSSEDEKLMRASAQRLLQTTGKRQLDLMHAYPEFAQPNWTLFRRWKEEGLAKYIGVARHHERYYDTMIKMMKTETVDILQVNYSPLETAAEREVLPMALEKGVAVTINRPFINGEYFSHVRGHPLPEWAAEFDCKSWAQFSLKFVLSHPAVTCVLTETANPRHAVDNLNAGLGRMPDEKTRQKMLRHLRAL